MTTTANTHIASALAAIACAIITIGFSVAPAVASISGTIA
jgi:hypothetical protein